MSSSSHWPDRWQWLWSRVPRKTPQKTAAPPCGFGGSATWMGLSAYSLLMPTECKHQEQPHSLGASVGIWPDLSPQRRCCQANSHLGNAELFLDSDLVVHPGNTSQGKLAETSKTRLRSCNGGLPILPCWLAAKVDWFQVSRWQGQQCFLLLRISNLCVGRVLQEEGHGVELEGCQRFM